MSRILYSNDYITLVWEVRNVKDSATQPARKMLKLILTIQVNGKLKNHSYYINLEKNEYSDSGFWLQNYNEWYNVRNLLIDLWYPVEDKMNTWLSDLLDEKIKLVSDISE